MRRLRQHRSFFLAPVLALSVACGLEGGTGTGGSGEDGDADGSSDTGEGISCEDAGPLELGRCEVPDTGEHCAGDSAGGLTFVELQAGDGMSLVQGPQGSTMLLFLARTNGIMPGDVDNPIDPENPLITLELFDGEDKLSTYRGRVAFEESGDVQTSWSGLFVVLEENPGDLIGLELRAEASLRDADGEVRCGDATVLVEP